jgi:hypothetical protein
MKLLRFCLLAATLPLYGHVGSPDVFYKGSAGPYPLMVTIRPPQVVPGVAEIEIRAQSTDVQRIHIVPLRLGIKTQQFTPVPDLAQPSREDRQFYTGTLWLMTSGSWQVRIDVDGAQGSGRMSVPVPAVATRVIGMQKAIAVVLIPLALVLCVGVVSIAGAAVREGVLEPGSMPDKPRVRRSRIVMAVAALLVIGAMWFGDSWWSADASSYGRIVFKPMRLEPSVQGNRLELTLDNPGWLGRKTDDLLLDHNHLMHLYVIRVPDMDMVWHLHPDRQPDGKFAQLLPAMPAGKYALYGDIVHANGFAETATGEIDVQQIAGAPLAGDDAGGNVTNPLATGYRIVWDRPPAPLRAKQPYDFRFRLEDAQGKPAGGMELYMGMLGHAAFVSTDRTAFAHVHPIGSVPMPAVALAQPDNPHAGHTMITGAIPSEVSFPYGFPKAGAYRIFVQMKHAGEVATGAFDAQVEP